MHEQEIEELRQRRRQLIRMREEERQRQEDGDGDNLNLFILNEEIASINDRLRQIDPRLRRKHRGSPLSRVGDTIGKSATANVNSDRKEWMEWLLSDREDNRDALATMARVVSEADRYLKPRQLEAYALWRDGASIGDIADQMGVVKSTASRLVASAKSTIRRELEAQSLPQIGGRALLDMSDATTATAVLACLTGKQAVYLYLYYGESLTLRDIGQLLEVDYAGVSKGITRGLANVSKALHYKAAELENLEALGDVAYELFREDFAPPPETVARTAKTTDWGRRALGKAPRAKPMPRQVTVIAQRGGNKTLKSSGKLLKELLATAGLTRLRQWLEALFGRAAKLARDARRKKERLERTASYVLR